MRKEITRFNMVYNFRIFFFLISPKVREIFLPRTLTILLMVDRVSAKVKYLKTPFNWKGRLTLKQWRNPHELSLSK